MNAPMFELNGLSIAYGKLQALKSVSLAFDKSQLVAVVGPNGAGKTTLIAIMAGLRTHYQGSCRFEGRELPEWSRKQFAQRVSVVPQSVRVDFPFTAEQVVLMGRTPFADSLFESDDDAVHVQRAMELTETVAFRSREFQTLSGGEKQRVILAAALAQTPSALLLDEPTTFLDLQHQIELYRLLKKLADGGMLVVTITHDLNLASTFADRVVVMQQGECVADGPPSDVFRPKLLQDVFRVSGVITQSPAGRPWMLYGA